ncbi:ComEC/Rec2 family competence protein [Azospirillum thermophilum]|uniref:ComEC/Rec2 family competence protein n=1 Tax=Azospirillum thermophilum TaxID=2202148 RepID=UPI001FEB5815|nr:ComEC/Rec2 family competence protein [Azospirillum thermophilum]
MTEGLASDPEDSPPAGAAHAKDSPFGPVLCALAAGWSRLGRELEADRDRWILWLPVGLGGGVALYFALPAEPPGWASMATVGVPALLMILLRSRPAALAGLMLLVAVAGGFALAALRTVLVERPMLTRDLGFVTVTGRVMAVERQPDAVRVTLADPVVDRLKPAETPGAVRIRITGRHPPPQPGTVIRLRTSLSPPAPPAEPGAFDFQRRAFFMGLGGVGFSTSRPELVEAPPPGGWRAVSIAFETARAYIARRVAETIPDPAEAGVTAALLNGEEAAIPEPTMEAFRNSGLAHLLSISGLHVGIAAGILYHLVRALLALVPFVALRWPIKKIAALSGILSALAYTMLVGAPLPTLRSVLMTGLVMVAIIADRDPLSMRLVAFAAVVTIATDPEGMLGPSFQMSFAAVVALIAVYERVGAPLAELRQGLGWIGQALFYVGGIMLTSVIATAATTPFSLFHFQQIAFYGVLSNMIAIPLTSFWVMPWSLVSYALLPFGVEGPALVAMNWGVRGIIATAEFFGSLPGAALLVPAMPAAGFAAVVSGGIWLCAWTRRWRWWGLVAIVAGLASPALVARPDLLVSVDGRLMAARGPDGRLSLSRDSEGRVADTWLRRDGAREPDEPWPEVGTAAGGRLRCDALGCLYRLNGRTVALLRAPDALPEDCAAADLVIVAQPARGCRAPLVVDRWRLRREGAQAIFLDPGGIRLDSVRGLRGDRPWTGLPVPP